MKETEGEWRVGMKFNPAGDDHVTLIKQHTAKLIDLIAEHGRDDRCTALAQTAFEDGAMWAVKSITKPDREVE